MKKTRSQKSGVRVPLSIQFLFLESFTRNVREELVGSIILNACFMLRVAFVIVAHSLPPLPVQVHIFQKPLFTPSFSGCLY